MAKQKTIPQLEAEKAENERRLSQLQHKKQQLENRITYYEKGDRCKRAHHLITRGAAIESVAPLTNALRELVKGVYIEAPDKSSGKRRQNIRISYDFVGFIPLNELMKEETA